MPVISIPLNKLQKVTIAWLLVCSFVLPVNLGHAAVPDTIERTLPSIVGVGTIQNTRRPPAKLSGTGFVVGDGRHVITNAHVIPDNIDTARLEYLAVFIGKPLKPY